jgi:hypothetical protein
VDGFFTPVLTALEKLQKALTADVKAYLDHVADMERRAREKAAAEARAEEERLRREAAEAARKAAEADRRDRAAALAAQAAADQAARDAAQAQARTAEAEVHARATPANLARTRSDVGTLSTLQSVWTHEVEDYDVIPLDQLRAYIPRETIDRAIRQAVKMGVRKLPGVRIFETSKAMIR